MTRLLMSLFCLSCVLAGSSQAQERSWSLDTSDTEAFLTFGVEESDDVGISFWCVMQSGSIHVFLPEADSTLKPGRKTRISISAAGKSTRLQAKTLSNEEAATTSVEAIVDARHPIFDTLKTVDRFAIKVGKETQNFPLDGTEMESLLRICRKP